MKILLTPKPKRGHTEGKYPYLAQTDEGNPGLTFIMLFVSPNRGVWLYSDWLMGEIQELDESTFTPFEEVLQLANG